MKTEGSRRLGSDRLVRGHAGFQFQQSRGHLAELVAELVTLKLVFHSKTALSAMLLAQLGWLPRQHEEWVLQTLTDLLAQAAVPGVTITPWKPHGIPEAHSVHVAGLPDLHNRLRRAERSLDLMRYVEKGQAGQRAAVGAIRRAGITIRPYAEFDHTRAELDRLVDAFVWTDGTPRLGLEFKNYGTAFLSRPTQKMRLLAELHRALGMKYVVCAPGATNGFYHQLALHGAFGIGHGAFSVDAKSHRDRVVANLPMPFAVVVVEPSDFGTRSDWPSLPEPHASTLVNGTETAMAGIDPAATDSDEADGLYLQLTESGRRSRSRRRTVKPRPEDKLKTVADLIADLNRAFRPFHCLGCGRGQGVECAPRCQLAGEPRYETPLPKTLALIIGVDERTIRNHAPPGSPLCTWSPGRPRKRGS